MWLEGWGGGLALLQVAEVHARLGETKPKLTNVCKEIKGQKGVEGDSPWVCCGRWRLRGCNRTRLGGTAARESRDVMSNGGGGGAEGAEGALDLGQLEAAHGRVGAQLRRRQRLRMKQWPPEAQTHR